MFGHFQSHRRQIEHLPLFVGARCHPDQRYLTVTTALDRVHPNVAGHLVLARAFLEAIGFRW